MNSNIKNVFLLTDLNLYIASLGVTTDTIITDLLQNTAISPEEVRTLMTFFALTILSSFLQNVIGAIVIAIAMCSVSSYVYKRFLNEDVSFQDSFKSAYAGELSTTSRHLKGKPSSEQPPQKTGSKVEKGGVD